MNAASHAISFRRMEEVLREPDLLRDWERLAEASGHLYSLYQSPAWCEHLEPLPAGERLAVGIVRTADGRVVGVVPVQSTSQSLDLKIGGRRLGSLPFRAAMIRGGSPLLPAGEEALAADFVRAALAEFPECAAVSFQFGLPEHDPFRRAISNSAAMRACTLPYDPGQAPVFYMLRMPGSFEEYIHRFKSKTRYNLQRQVARWQEFCGGRLDVFRAETNDDVGTFFDGASAVLAQTRMTDATRGEFDASPQGRRKFAALAERGMFRSYLLRHDGATCAFALGFQHADTFYYSRIGFDERYAKQSPGTVLLYLLLEDLFRHRRPALVNFYSGNWWYKELFSTDHVQAVLPLLFSPTAGSRRIVRCHAAFQTALRRMRGLRRIKSLFTYLRQYGLRAAVDHALFRVSESWYERHLGIRTSAVTQLSEFGITDRNCGECRSTSYLTILRSLRRLRVKPGRDVLLDFGAGSGRVLAVAATFPFKKVIGVEFIPGIADLARENVRKARRHFRCPDVDVVTCDSREYDIPAETTVFYVYNSFGGEILATVLARIRRSLAEHPRAHTIVYIRPPGHGAGWMGEQPWLKRKLELTGAKGMGVFFYEVDPHAAA